MAKVDLRKFRERIRLLEETGREADRAVIEALGGFFVDTVTGLTPKDTNRAANGWIQAGREAGVTRRAMLPYLASSRRAVWIARLEEEIVQRERTIGRMQARLEGAKAEDAKKAGLRRLDGEAYARRENQRWFKDMERRLRLYKRRLKRSHEELAKANGAESFVFFDQRFDARRSFSTVRVPIYGGTGRIESDAFGDRIELINREPHVRLIERNPNLGHPFATAVNLTRSAGFAVARDKYFEVSRRRLRSAA